MQALFELLLLSLGIIVPLLIAIAYFTLVERKIMALIQHRQGPIFIGIFGLLQPLADGFKLILKEIIIPSRSNIVLFFLAPIFTFALSVTSWSFIPFNYVTVGFDFEFGVLGLLLFSSLNVYTIILSGWSSNSYYAFLGSVRAISQMLSYEVSIGFSLLPPLLYSGSLNLIDIVISQEFTYFFLPFLPISLIFLVSIIAETNRAPFDLPEAEAEIVAGYNIEYSSILFALFFLGEYSNILLMSGFYSVLFLGGWLSFSSFILFPPGLIFSLKICALVYFFVFVRANLPRYRYDQLLSLGWKIFLPVAFTYFIFLAAFFLVFNYLPLNQDFYIFSYQRYLYSILAI